MATILYILIFHTIDLEVLSYWGLALLNIVLIVCCPTQKLSCFYFRPHFRHVRPSENTIRTWEVLMRPGWPLGKKAITTSVQDRLSTNICQYLDMISIMIKCVLLNCLKMKMYVQIKYIPNTIHNKRTVQDSTVSAVQ